MLGVCQFRHPGGSLGKGSRSGSPTERDRSVSDGRLSPPVGVVSARTRPWPPSSVVAAASGFLRLGRGLLLLRGPLGRSLALPMRPILLVVRMLGARPASSNLSARPLPRAPSVISTSMFHAWVKPRVDERHEHEVDRHAPDRSRAHATFCSRIHRVMATQLPERVGGRGQMPDATSEKMRMEGLEPPRDEAHRVLSAARLPVPPHPRCRDCRRPVCRIESGLSGALA